MHIAEGILSGPTLAVGAATAVGGIAIGLWRLDYERIPRVAVLASAFFVASLIHVPVGPSSAHLVLNGLCGLILGWAAFPALAVALLLQAVLFGFGGLTTLGVNTTVMALPSVVCFALFNRAARTATRRAAIFAAGFGAGTMAIAISCGLLAASLVTARREFAGLAGVVVLAHVPVMLIEGLITGAVVVFLRTVKPELLQAPVRHGD